MTRPFLIHFASALLGLALSITGAATCSAQRASALPKLDLDKLTGTWYEIAKLPTKAEKKCLSDNTVLYALSDKANTFQIGTFCTVKGGDQDNINDSGKQDKQLDGALKVRHWVLFHRPYWILATGPNFHWALVGTPNHKSLWILARQPTLPGDLYSQLQNTAAAQGYPVAKLVLVTHPQDRTTIASPSANPNQIESPTPTPTQAPVQPSSTAGSPDEAAGSIPSPSENPVQFRRLLRKLISTSTSRSRKAIQSRLFASPATLAPYMHTHT